MEHAKEPDKALPRDSTLPVFIPEENSDHCWQNIAEDQFERREVSVKKIYELLIYKAEEFIIMLRPIGSEQ